MAALGVQLLQFVLLMKLRLQDATDTLDAFLWRDAVSVVTIKRRGAQEKRCCCGGDDGDDNGFSHQELFFGVSAEKAAASQEAQDIISRTMSSLCPPEGSTGTLGKRKHQIAAG